MYQQYRNESEQPAAALREQKCDSRQRKTPSAQNAKNRIRATGRKGQTERQHQIEIASKPVVVFKKRCDATFPCRNLCNFILNRVEHVVEHGITTRECLPEPEDRNGNG